MKKFSLCFLGVLSALSLSFFIGQANAGKLQRDFEKLYSEQELHLPEPSPVNTSVQDVRKPLVVLPQGEEEPITPPPESDLQEPAAVKDAKESLASVDEFPVKTWEAFSGSNIREVLSSWSQEADVQLIWALQKEFSVLESFNVSGHYTKAVQDLLEQYQQAEMRPVGTLHIHPETGERVLVVRASRHQ